MNAPVLAATAILGLPLLALGAQPPRQPDASRLARAIERLSIVGRVLYVAAHPDDENTRFLAWLVQAPRVRAAYLSITRGDGGQNLIGPEQGVDLGLIRTQELLAARRVDGAEQLFTRARDFGYSKSPEETLRIWGKDEILADVVLAIRRFQPDVIVTRFPTSGLETHGHHTASAILAGEAFRLAGDPSYRPEQVARYGAWKARRLVQNKPIFGGKPPPGEDLTGWLAVDVGGYDPTLGLSYGELAADSRGMHKSQGFGVARARGPSLEYFKVLDGEPMQRSLFDGIELDWMRVRGGGKVEAALLKARRAFDLARPDKALLPLAAARAELAKLPVTPLTRDKLAELDEVMLACAGVHLDVTTGEHEVVPGGTLPIVLGAINRSPADVQLLGAELSDGTSVELHEKLTNDRPFSQSRTLAIPGDVSLANPYWLDLPPEAGRFEVADASLIGLPERPSALWAELDLSIAGTRLRVRRDVYKQWVDPVAGERQRAVEILPAVTVDLTTPLLVFADDKARTVRVRLRATVAEVRGEARLAVPDGFRVEPTRQPFQLGARDAEAELSFQVTPPRRASDGILRAIVEIGDTRLERGLLHIEHAHIPIQTRLPVAEARLVRLELSHTRRRIGYIAGAGDEVPAALREVGYEVTMLSDEALREPLGHYEAIVAGVRAFNVRPSLSLLHDRLMAYVAAGGTLVVQYNTNNRLSKAPSELGPYPFEISQERVTDERAVVGSAAHSVLQTPNRIGAEDFAGWVQERGLYFAGKWDPRYEAPLSMHDPGEPPRKGSLLVARVGKGAFVYTGLAFFRQLPAGVPGAFRLFANLLELR
jgi:LmbE family N-acetylglucosaminyl deacetylase